MNEISVAVFESTRMSCDLMARALSEPRHGIKVVYTDISSRLSHEDCLKDLTVAIVSLDLADGPSAGMALLHRLSKIKRDINFILLIDQDDREIVTEAFGAGAVGLFQRDQPYEQLVKCIQCVHNGQVWASSQQLRYALDAFAGSQMPGSHGRIAGGLLSKREEEIVAKVAQGLKNREIANLLFISENTIKNHLFRIFSRLGISSRAELILFAHGHRLFNDQVHSDESDLKIVRNL